MTAGVKYAPKNQYYNKILIQQQSTVLRGICAVEIMLGHIGIATGSLLLYPNRKAGILFVGIFFMLSGYGLSYGVSHKETYLDHFLLKKMLKILIPAVIIWIVARGVQMLLDPPIHNITSFFESTNWYVWEILGYYICFWLVYKLLRQIIGKCKWGGGGNNFRMYHSLCWNCISDEANKAMVRKHSMFAIRDILPTV